MMLLDHTANAARLPRSILPETEAVTIARLMGEEINELESAYVDWMDPEQLSGINLDKLGKIKGVSREEKTDAEMRAEILAVAEEVERYTFHALIAYMNTFAAPGITPSIREFWLGIDHFFNMDGRSLLDGTDLMEPENRPMSVLLDWTIRPDAIPAVVIKGIELVRGPTITLYHRMKLKTSPADWGLTGTPDEAVVFSSGTEMARFPVSGPVYEIDLYQSRCNEASEILLFESGVQVGQLLIGNNTLSIRYELFITIEE